MIVAIGVDIDRTFARFVTQAVASRLRIHLVNLRTVMKADWRFDVPARSPAIFKVDGENLELDPHDAFFCRILDFSAYESDRAKAACLRSFIGGLTAWLNGVPGRVVNRPTACRHNGSKPLHEALLQEMGFRVPESLTTCDVDALRQFVRQGPAISKTVCGVRAETSRVSERDFEEFQPESGPVHLQRLIAGADVRVHVVAESLVAQRLTTAAIDYRSEPNFGELKACDLPPGLRELLVRSAGDMGLVFTGWDFKVDDDGVFWCLEANPMPGYGAYDIQCDGQISRELLRYLSADAPA